MKRGKLLFKIPEIFTGFKSVENCFDEYFIIRVSAPLFLAELYELREIFNAVEISYHDDYFCILCTDYK